MWGWSTHLPNAFDIVQWVGINLKTFDLDDKNWMSVLLIYARDYDGNNDGCYDNNNYYDDADDNDQAEADKQDLSSGVG